MKYRILDVVVDYLPNVIDLIIDDANGGTCQVVGAEMHVEIDSKISGSAI